jgi:hypothetical protein
MRSREIISCSTVRILSLFRAKSVMSSCFVDAGHGSQVRNLDNTEEDGYDEGEYHIL